MSVSGDIGTSEGLLSPDHFREADLSVPTVFLVLVCLRYAEIIEKAVFMAQMMKSIMYRGGVVKFRIPSHWREEYSDMEGGTFYEDRPDSGTLRLKLTTMSTRQDLHADSGEDILAIVIRHLEKRVEVRLTTRHDGNAALRYEEAAIERGTRLTIMYWMVAQSLPPHRARVATFSYTFLARQTDDEFVRRDLELLEQEIESAIFADELGVVSG